MNKHIRKHIHFDSGEIFIHQDGRRILLAECKPRIDLYELETHIPTIGAGYKVKRIKAALVICFETEPDVSVDEEFLTSVDGFDLVATLYQGNHETEDFRFSNVSPVEIDLHGEWKFELNDRQTKHLFDTMT